jgi:hypothetical protein
MKKLVYTVFVAFWAAIATLVVLNALSPDANEERPRAEAGPDGLAGYSLTEVAEHDTLEDCWMVIEGVVYDISDYVPRHPAPPRVLAPWCGREATEGMRTKGDSSDHSARAWRMLERYRLGRLVEAEQASRRGNGT